MTADSVSRSSVSRAVALTALCVIFGYGEDASIGRYTAMIEPAGIDGGGDDRIAVADPQNRLMRSECIVIVSRDELVLHGRRLLDEADWNRVPKRTPI